MDIATDYTFCIQCTLQKCRAGDVLPKDQWIHDTHESQNHPTFLRQKRSKCYDIRLCYSNVTSHQICLVHPTASTHSENEILFDIHFVKEVCVAVSAPSSKICRNMYSAANAFRFLVKLNCRVFGFWALGSGELGGTHTHTPLFVFMKYQKLISNVSCERFYFANIFYWMKLWLNGIFPIILFNKYITAIRVERSYIKHGICFKRINHFGSHWIAALLFWNVSSKLGFEGHLMMANVQISFNRLYNW